DIECLLVVLDDTVQDAERRFLGGSIAPGTLFERKLIEPAAAEEQVVDVAQEDDFHVLGLRIARAPGDVVEGAAESDRGQEVRPGCIVHQVQVADEGKHGYLLQSSSRQERCARDLKPTPRMGVREHRGISLPSFWLNLFNL